ncbi:MAG TPA: alcohol dehydrogenase catalytic domain-containing protein [Dongiaceae bacterium]|nr:alcohol dehydrogenase catalytic domain-containing protein [Dongiaceae bacterium]
MKQMRAAVLMRQGQPLELREMPVPVPGPGELLIELEACGICHSDLHVRDGDAMASASLTLPLILGHEGVGRVVAGSADVTRYKTGDRLGLPWMHDTCCHCTSCLTGWESYCGQQRAHGYNVHGGFAQYAIVKEDFTVAIPENISAIDAAPLLCAGVTAYGAIAQAELTPAKSCMVVGCGGLGQYAIQLARHAGATVFAVDSSEEKLDIARKLGADHVFLAQDSPGSRIRELGGADACLNFAPTAKPWCDMLQAVKPRGWIIAVAMVPDEVPLNMEWLTGTGVKITGSSVGTRQQLREVMEIASRRGLSIPLETVSLSDVDATLSRLAKGEIKGRAVVDFSLG